MPRENRAAQRASAKTMPGAAGRGKSEDALGLEIATDEHGNKIAPPVIGD